MAGGRVVSKINVIMAKKGRDEHYKTSLYYLRLILYGHNVKLYKTDCTEKIFNKSKALNKSLSEMREDYDFVCVFDVDMIYRYQFFNDIEGLINRGYDYIVSYGMKLSKEDTEDIFKRRHRYFAYNGEKFQGCSQITLTKKALGVFKTYFGDKLYDEEYKGWGGEDSDLSFKSKILSENNLIKKTSLAAVWFHLWHPESRPKDYREKDKNSIRFQSSKEKIIERVANHVP